MKILVNSESEDDQEYFNQDNDIYENISSSEYSIESEEENCEFKACSFSRLNVISKDKNILLDLVDSIEDPELQRKYLIKIKDLITKEESNMIENNKEYGMKNVLEKFKKEKKSSNVTIKDLQEEIGKIKREIKKLKENNKLIKNIVLGESSKEKENLEINVKNENMIVAIIIVLMII